MSGVFVSALDFSKWLKIFDYKNLEGFLRSEKGHGGTGEAVLRFLVSYMVYQVPITLISLVRILFAGALLGAASAALGGLVGGVGITATLISFAAGVVLSPLFFLIGNLTQHIIAGALGGRGRYSDFLHLDSYVSAASYLGALAIGIIPQLLTLIPAIGTLLGGGLSCLLIPVAIIFGLYMLYASYKTIQVNYELSGGRAAAAFILNILLWIAIGLVILVIFYLIFGAALLSSLVVPGLAK